jgi:magnesium chelatase family protein
MVRPGEISLAHFGVLFLDEAPEFRANVLQSLREPREDRVITISRAEGQVRLPADFQLLLAANPCPCGRLGRAAPGEKNAGGAVCFCSSQEIYRYWRKFGGALLDRVELRAVVKDPGFARPDCGGEESSAGVARRVLRAVEIQGERFRCAGIRRNARIPPALIERFCPLTDSAALALAGAAEKLGLSGRAFHGIRKTARTIADLEERDTIDAVHILEAVQHRRPGEDPYDIFGAD